jgi:hypothetical protein
MKRFDVAQHHAPWNKGKLVGQNAPFKLKEIWRPSHRGLLNYLSSA